MTRQDDIFVVSGPVIIEEGRVLLNREIKDDAITDWFFPGGKLEHFDQTLEETCIRETKEETGIDITILKPLRTVLDRIDGRTAILVHYLAERNDPNQLLKPGPDVYEIAWHDTRKLPDNTAHNVRLIIVDLVDKRFE